MEQIKELLSEYKGVLDVYTDTSYTKITLTAKNTFAGELTCYLQVCQLMNGIIYVSCYEETGKFKPICDKTAKDKAEAIEYIKTLLKVFNFSHKESEQLSLL